MSSENTSRNGYKSQWSRDKHEEVGDIGELPDVADPQRRDRCEADFSLWRATYCSPRHGYPDSQNHAILCDRLQTAIESKNDWFGIMAPRGEAKTTTIVESLGWAVASGRKRFPVCYSSSSATNGIVVESFSSLFRLLPVLAEDYPEICIPVRRKTEKSKQRQVIYQGQSLNIYWEYFDSGLIYFGFPDISWSKSSGSLLLAQSFGSKIRGQQYIAPDGRVVRPDLAFLDDIQDPKIAKSFDRIQENWDKITIDVNGLSGDDPMPIINSGTPFHTECLMGRTVSDRRFSGLTMKSIYQFPKRMDLWDKYQQIWESSYDDKVLELGTFHKNAASKHAYEVAMRFYLDNREAMDEGMEMAWEGKYSSTKKYDGASAIENIMREYLISLGPEVFSQEKQCELKTLASDDIEFFTEDIFLSKIDQSLPEFISPNEAKTLIFSIDLHDKLLYFGGAAYAEGFNGHVITYGTWPEQPGTNWTHKDAKATLGRKYPKHGKQGVIYAGLRDLVEVILSKKYFREDGSEIFVGKIIIDNNDGDFQATVKKFVEESPHKSKLVMYFGKWYGAGTQQRQKTDKGGPEWRWDRYSNSRNCIIAFRDFWKSYNLDRWLTPRGDAGCKTMFRGGLQKFRKFYNELTAQKPHWVTLTGNQTLRRWPTTEDMKGVDDHFGDVDFLLTLGASVDGITQEVEKQKQRQVVYAEVPDNLKPGNASRRRNRR